MGAYMAFGLKMMAASQPMLGAIFPPTNTLATLENDPPMVSWFASHEGRVVSFVGVPIRSVANLTNYFVLMGTAMGGEMPAPPPGGNGGDEGDVDIW